MEFDEDSRACLAGMKIAESLLPEAAIYQVKALNVALSILSVEISNGGELVSIDPITAEERKRWGI